MNDQIIINIHQLGAIRNAKITLNQFMIFSGASGLGKSYAAMLVHFVYRVLTGEELETFFKQNKAAVGDVSRFQDMEAHEIFAFDANEFVRWVNERAKEYMVQILSYPGLNMNVNIEFQGLPETLRFYYRNTENMSSIVDAGRDSFGSISMDETHKNMTSFPLSMLPQLNTYLFSLAFASRLSIKYLTTFVSSTFLMPPSRGAIMQIPLDSQLVVFESTPMYKEFLQQFARIRSNSNSSQRSIVTTSITNGQFEEEDGELIFNTHDTQMPISAAASSIKEIAPFVIMAEKGMVSKYSTLFEEPESHLHPEMQTAVVDVLAQMLQRGALFQITTHSDYVLRRINDLIYLHLLREKWGDDERFNNFCEKYGLNNTISINPSIVKAYYFKEEENGLSSIIEQNLSKGVPFDTFETVIEKNFPISAEIYEQFEELS